LSRPGIAAGGCAALERGVVNGNGAADVGTPTLRAAAAATILLVTWTVASLSTGGVAVIDSRAVDVESATSSRRATFGG
jgi:hypothetical protein